MSHGLDRLLQRWRHRKNLPPSSLQPPSSLKAARAGRARGDCGTVLSEVVAIFACLSTKHKSEVISFVHAVVDTKIDTCKHPTHNVAADFA